MCATPLPDQWKRCVLTNTAPKSHPATTTAKTMKTTKKVRKFGTAFPPSASRYPHDVEGVHYLDRQGGGKQHPVTLSTFSC
jgi:hypothetical protein